MEKLELVFIAEHIPVLSVVEMLILGYWRKCTCTPDVFVLSRRT